MCLFSDIWVSALLLEARKEDSGVAGLLFGNRSMLAGVFTPLRIRLSAAGSEPEEYAESWTVLEDSCMTDCLALEEFGSTG